MAKARPRPPVPFFATCRSHHHALTGTQLALWLAFAGALCAVGCGATTESPCHPGARQHLSRPSAGVVRDRIRYTLCVEDAEVCVWQPIRFRLRVENLDDTSRRVPRALGFRFRVVEAGSTVLSQLIASPPGIGPDETVDLRPLQSVDFVLLPKDEDRCRDPGASTWQYVHLDEKGRTLFRSNAVEVRCAEQPIRLMPDVPSDVADSLLALKREPSPSRITSGAHTAIEVSGAMTRLQELGPRAIPGLLLNLDVHDVQEQIAVVLGEVRAAEAVPALLETLWMSDSAHDRLILNSLARITGWPSDERLFHQWGDAAARAAIVKEFRKWDVRRRASTRQPD